MAGLSTTVNVGGTEIISLMLYPFFYLFLAYLMHKRQELLKDTKEKNQLHSFFFLFFIAIGMFSMYVPLTTLDTYFNSTAPYNESVGHVMAPSLMTLGFTLITFLALVIVLWVFRLLKRKEEMI